MCALTGCLAPDPGERTSVQGVYSISITGMDLLGAFPAPADWGNGFGSLTFEAYGAFPTSTGLSYRAHVTCDGKEWPSIIIPGWSQNQIDISIPNYPPEYPPGTACWFMLELSDPGNRASPSYSNVFGPLAPLVITDGVDDGVSGGQHRYTLRGPGISSTATYTSQVTCGGSAVSSSLISKTNGSADIQFASSSSPRSCSLRLATSAGLSSAWNIRDGGPAPSAPANLGMYYWGGHQSNTTPNALGDGVSILNQAGFGNTVRLVVYPGMRLPGIDDTRLGASVVNTGYDTVYSFPDSNPYMLPQPFCPPGSASFLECAMRSNDFQQAFANVNNGGTIILTALDAASNGDYGYCVTANNTACIADTDYLNQHADIIRNEYRDATFALYQTQHDTNKTFVIDNWETDNLIFCEGAGGYAYNIHELDRLPDCDHLAAIYDRIGGLYTWFLLRQQGIQAGIAQARASNYQGVTVVDGIEIASIHWLQDISAPSTLENIVSLILPGFVSYSAWDSTLLRGSLDEDLAAISARLATFSTSPITGHRPYLILGELGIPDPSSDAAHVWRYQQTIEAAFRANVPRPTTPSPGPPLTVLWQAYTAIGWNWQQPTGLQLASTATSDNHQGLFFSNGEEQPPTSGIRTALANYASTGILQPQSTFITTIVDLGITSGLHFFELWGLFPSPDQPYSVTVTCDGANYPGTVYYQNTNTEQINIYIPDPGSGTCPECNCGGHSQCYPNGFGGCRPQGRWCTFSVARSGTTGSPVFGPRHVCPGDPGSGIPYPQGQDWQGQCMSGLGGC